MTAFYRLASKCCQPAERRVSPSNGRAGACSETSVRLCDCAVDCLQISSANCELRNSVARAGAASFTGYSSGARLHHEGGPSPGPLPFRIPLAGRHVLPARVGTCQLLQTGRRHLIMQGTSLFTVRNTQSATRNSQLATRN